MKKVKLGSILHLHIDEICIDNTAIYPMSGVYSYGRGLMKREPLSGMNTSYKKFHRLHIDDFVLSQLKGWEGAMALVTEEFDGYFLSPQFPTFRAIPDILDIRYLDWYCKQPVVWSELLSNSRGMGARRSSVTPKQFLSLEIPLPPLDEQRRIVSRIEALASRVAEAQRLRAEVRQDLQRMLQSVYSQLIVNAKFGRMADIAPIIRRPIGVDDSENYQELGIRSFGKGTFHKPSIKGIDIGSKRIFQIQPGDLLFSNVFAWEGAIAVVKPDDEGRVGSHRFISCVPKAGVASAKFLCFHLLTECVKNSETKTSEKIPSKRERTITAANHFGGGEAAPRIQGSVLSAMVATPGAGGLIHTVVGSDVGTGGP